MFTFRLSPFWLLCPCLTIAGLSEELCCTPVSVCLKPQRCHVNHFVSIGLPCQDFTATLNPCLAHFLPPPSLPTTFYPQTFSLLPNDRCHVLSSRIALLAACTASCSDPVLIDLLPCYPFRWPPMIVCLPSVSSRKLNFLLSVPVSRRKLQCYLFRFPGSSAS